MLNLLTYLLLPQYHKEISTFSVTLESLVFLESLDKRILEPFVELKNLHQDQKL